MSKVQNVFLVGAKSLGAYGGYETYVFPKLEFGKPNQDQEPLLDRKLFNKLMEL